MAIIESRELANIRNTASQLTPPKEFKNWGEFGAKFWPDYFSGVDKEKIKVKVNLNTQEDHGAGGIRISVELFDTVNNYRIVNILGFDLSYFQACCAMYSLHNFSHCAIPGSYDTNSLDPIYKSLFKPMMEAILSQIWVSRTNPNRRIQTMMVEQGHREGTGRVNNESTTVVEPVEKPVMNYSMFYRFYKERAHVQEMLAVNTNTNNIIHIMDVVCKF